MGSRFSSSIVLNDMGQRRALTSRPCLKLSKYALSFRILHKNSSFAAAAAADSVHAIGHPLMRRARRAVTDDEEDDGTAGASITWPAEEVERSLRLKGRLVSHLHSDSQSHTRIERANKSRNRLRGDQS